jgi:aminopeptidase N
MGSRRLAGAVLAAAVHAAAPYAFAQGPAAVREYEPGIDARRYAFHVVIPDTGHSIAVTATLEFRRTQNVGGLRLDLESPMKVSSVKLNGREVDYSRDENSIGVALPRWNPQCALPAAGDQGDACTDTVSVEAKGIPTDGLIISQDSAGNWQYFADHWPNRARNWLATIDHPSDKAAVEWRVHAPSALTVVANGVQLEKSPLPNERARSVTVWRTARPIPTYLMVIGVARMARVDLATATGANCGRGESGSCVAQDVYEMPGLSPRTPPGFAAAGRIVSWLSRVVAPFPYERLSHVQSSTRFGGMENASAIFYADGQFRRMTLGEGLVAHETAHQWFGDAVTPLRWADLWLSEGFATYFASLWEREARGDTAFRRSLNGLKRTVIGAPEVATRPVVDTLQTDLMELLNANSYQKGGFVLHMLRKEIGDSVWTRGIRAYYAGHRHANATTDDLRRAMEAEAKTDLRWFFDQWLRRPGFAELSTSWTFDENLEVRISQGTRFPPYRLTVAIEVEEADGTIMRTKVDVPALNETQVAIEGRRTQKPRRVTVDPDGDLLAVITAR